MSGPSESHPPASRLRIVLALATVFACGCLVAVQSRINGELGQRLGDGFLAALISFASGLVVLFVGAIFWRPGRLGVRRVVDAVRTREMPWWYALGGAAGASFVLGQGLTVGLLGVALFTVATVCGQTIASLVVDHRGLGTMRPRPATPLRIVGAALAVVAVGIAVSDRIREDAPYLALLLPLVAGVAIGWQQAVNGQIRSVSRSAFTATIINFLVGTVVLVVAAIIHAAVVGWHVEFPSEPWLYVGGLVGIVFIAVTAVIVRIIGVLLLGVALLAGQLTTSVLFDLFLPVEGAHLTATTLVGTVLIFAAVTLVAVPSPGRGVRGTSGGPAR
jgi:transporter family-2 protein